MERRQSSTSVAGASGSAPGQVTEFTHALQNGKINKNMKQNRQCKIGQSVRLGSKGYVLSVKWNACFT